MSDRPGKTALARLSAVAQTQGGFFTAKQAERAGFDPTHHTYHVRAGNWERVHRGIYRLARYPRPERSDLITWSLWSRDRRHDRPQGVFSHQTALSLYDLSDVMPVELHLTVPPGFRRTAPLPAGLRFHHAELAAGEIREHEGYRVTSPLRAITDVALGQEEPAHLLRQAIVQARDRGLVTAAELAHARRRLPAALFRSQGNPPALAA